MKWIKLESELPEQEVPVLLYIDCCGRKQILMGNSDVTEEWNEYLKNLGNCG